MNETKKPFRDPNAKIKVEFDRAPLGERIKSKYLSLFFAEKVLWYIFRLILLIGISYVVLYPFITKIAGSFMSPADFVDVSVMIIPKNFTFDTYAAIFNELKYVEAFLNTFMLSITCAVIQTLVCCMIGYGLAKFKFKGGKYIFLLVILTMLVPHKTLKFSMFVNFRWFDFRGIIGTILNGSGLVEVPGLFGIIGRIFGAEEMYGGLNLINTYFPFILLSLAGIAFKNGLYIFLMRQFFRGVPDELEESAYIDGSGTFKTFMRIILPLSVPMMITVFLFAFSWQWTDSFYTGFFFSTTKTTLMPQIVGIPDSLKAASSAADVVAGQSIYFSAIRNTCGLMIIAPLVIVYVFCQKFLVQGIERSGLTAD